MLTQITWNNSDFLSTACLNKLILPELGLGAKPCFSGSIKMNVVLNDCTGVCDCLRHKVPLMEAVRQYNVKDWW